MARLTFAALSVVCAVGQVLNAPLECAAAGPRYGVTLDGQALFAGTPLRAL